MLYNIFCIFFTPPKRGCQIAKSGVSLPLIAMSAAPMTSPLIRVPWRLSFCFSPLISLIICVHPWAAIFSPTDFTDFH